MIAQFYVITYKHHKMNTKTAYLIVRMAIGFSMFGHGLVRLQKLHIFSEFMLKQFENSMLPEILVLPFSYVLPIAEFVFGALIILGLFTRISAIAVSIMLISLILGSALIENWDAITAQLMHIAFIAYLIHNIEKNTYAIENIFKKK